ncbi:MAG: hypothetical protein QM754_06330 [Tepidisphaeraceae bacterium]
MADFINYKSVRVADPMPIGDGGIVMNQNFKKLADLTETYTHHQTVPSTAWTVLHNLGRPVQVTVVDDDGDLCITDVKIVDMNTVVIGGTRPFGGTVYVT